MGQDHSRDAGVLKISDYIHVDKWTPIEIDAFVRKVKRADGSSVKELYIPSWRVSFFRSGTGIELLDNCEDYNSGSGVYVRIDVDSATLLYNALTKHKEALTAANLVVGVFGKYVDSGLKL